MTIVAGFDVHRRQITFDALDTDTGELTRGRIDATPSAVERWVARFEGREVQVALEACTGWLFVCRALERAARSRIWPSRSRRARCAGASAARRPIARTRAGCARCSARGGCRSPGSRPSTCGSGAHARGCARRWSTSAPQWVQRIRATLFHHGISGAPDDLRSLAGREFLGELALPVDARERIAVALEMIDMLEIQIHQIEADLRSARAPADRLPGADDPVRDGRAHRAGHALRARRRLAPARLAQGRADGRDRHRRAPLRPRHAWGSSPARAPRTCAGRCMKPPSPRVGRRAPTTTTTSH